MKGVNFRVFVRSFFMETLWNYEKMQSAGFVFCLYPVLSRLYPDPRERTEAIVRHQSHVNTHPAMGPLLAGISARFESALDPAVVLPNRWRVMCVLAAIGDRVFWGNLKPLAAACGTLLGLCFFGSYVGCLVLLGVYNVPQILVRALGFREGWNQGLESLAVLRPPRLDEVLRVASGLTSMVLGMTAGLCAVLVMRMPGLGPDTLWGPLFGLGMAVLAGLGFLLLRRKVSLTAVVYCAILLVFIAVVTLFSGT